MQWPPVEPASSPSRYFPWNFVMANWSNFIRLTLPFSLPAVMCKCHGNLRTWTLYDTVRSSFLLPVVGKISVSVTSIFAYTWNREPYFCLLFLLRTYVMPIWHCHFFFCPVCRNGLALNACFLFSLVRTDRTNGYFHSLISGTDAAVQSLFLPLPSCWWEHMLNFGFGIFSVGSLFKWWSKCWQIQ